MPNNELENRLDEAYHLIEERIAVQKQHYDERNITYKRITFEDVPLDDILESHLLPLLPELINKYSDLPLKSKWKSYRVYIGTLCEIVKNGLVNRGILKTMDARIGVFDRNRHYELLKDALSFEGIEVINKPKKYEETIINEAGIPRGYHRKCIEFFRLYWKWLHNYDAIEREHFLWSFLNNNPLDKVYIIDDKDYYRMRTLRDETSSFSEKVVKTCLKFDSVFTAIDSYPETITEDNIEIVAAEISSKVGFDIFAVVRSNAVRQYILEYVKQVSFSKFAKIKQGLPDGETIILPTGKERKNCDYSFPNLIGGLHYIRGNAYEVSFPNSLSVEDYYSIELCKPLIYGNSIIYVSDEPITAEIDGYEKPSRTFINKAQEILYVFYERISPASFVYLDGVPLQVIEPFARKTYICKYWNTEEKHFKLALCIDTLKYANPSNSMRRVSFLCNSIEVLHGQTNRSGSYRLSDRLVPLTENLLTQQIIQTFIVNDEIVSEWPTEIADIYIWGRQSGIRINEEIDLSKWFGPPDVLIFSRSILNDVSFPIVFKYDEQGYHVYEGSFDKASDFIFINGQTIPIKRPTHSFIELQTDYDVFSEKICVNNNERLSIRVHNFDYNDTSQILLIEHGNERRSYNLLQLTEQDLENVCSLLPDSGEGSSGRIGRWTFVLFKENRRIDELSVEILPTIKVVPQKAFYSEGEDVIVKLCSSDGCFEQEGEFVDTKEMTIGKATISMTGNLVYSSPLQFDCYIDKCDIIQQLEYRPDVWGIKMMDIRSELWLENNLSSITLEELKHHGIFICSTIDIELSVFNENDKAKRLIHKGYNKLATKQFLWNFGSRTVINLSDRYGSIQKLHVICPAKITASKFESFSTTLVSTISYYGPANTNLDIRVYSGKNVIISVKRDVFRNSFSTAIYIDRSRIIDPELIIEARTGSQDFQRIAEEIIELQLPEANENEPETVQFSKSMSILSLISFEIPKKSINKTKSLVALLELGGAE